MGLVGSSYEIISGDDGRFHDWNSNPTASWLQRATTFMQLLGGMKVGGRQDKFTRARKPNNENARHSNCFRCLSSLTFGIAQAGDTNAPSTTGAAVGTPAPKPKAIRFPYRIRPLEERLIQAVIQSQLRRRRKARVSRKSRNKSLNLMQTNKEARARGRAAASVSLVLVSGRMGGEALPPT